MTRKRRRSGKTVPKKSNAAGLTALALCFTRQLQLQAPPAAVVAGEPAGGPSAAAAAANLLFSPVAVYAALALLAAGARGGTLQELLDALGGDSRDDLDAFARRAAERAVADRSRSLSGGGPAVAFACGAWLDAAWALLPAFRDAEARAVDFGNEPEKAVGEINGCLAAATNNHIDSILDPSSVDTRTTLVLVEKVASGPGFWHYRLPTSQVPVGDFRLPKFEVFASGSVREALSDGMGIKSAFVAGEADLADMAAKRDEDADTAGTPLYVADVCHKAVIEVNEGGTVANGATASYMLCGASAVMDQPVKVDFVADHPFVFFVIEEVSRAIVFVGRVLDPSISG
ncbi:unnamed protein product [Miscanthus lutarioriparius]|uniref:Serpin domain-containing protein n=1 Tax=Miscanthus lutarioriparius TaxID=422564 RepID=A0A811QJ13_9POAL|nr:unnamed protein product [Miscanthus lutarioriparius]